VAIWERRRLSKAAMMRAAEDRRPTPWGVLAAHKVWRRFSKAMSVRGAEDHRRLWRAQAARAMRAGVVPRITSQVPVARLVRLSWRARAGQRIRRPVSTVWLGRTAPALREGWEVSGPAGEGRRLGLALHVIRLKRTR
jgi:hypothetical protein